MDLLAERASGSGQQIFLLGRQDRPIGNRDTVEDLCNERRSSRRILTARLIRRNCFNLWSQLAISQLQWTHRAAMEPSHSLRNGASLPIVSIGRNSPGSCDVDNRAFAVKAANAFPRWCGSDRGEAGELFRQPGEMACWSPPISLRFRPHRYTRPLPNPIPRKMPAPGNSDIPSRVNTSSFPAAGLVPYSG